jgi:hypothetical protein
MHSARAVGTLDRRLSLSAVGVAQRAVFTAALVLAVLVPQAGNSYWSFPVLEHPWSLAPFAALFLVALLDLEHPRSLRNLDVLALAAPALTLALWSHVEHWQLVFAYGAMAYLLVRMALLGRIGRGSREAGGETHAMRATLPTRWLALGVLVLVGVHVSWTLDSSVGSDIGVAGVQGAQRLLDGHGLYGAQAALTRQYGFDPHLDSYGPLVYEATVPFAAVSHGLSAARLAALFFDLLSALMMFLLGRRRSIALGITLAFAWLSFPLSMYVAELASNDAMMVACLLATLLCLDAPARRGVALASAAWTKLCPLALLPLLAGQDLGRGRRLTPGLVRFAGCFAVVSAAIFTPVFAHGELATFLSRSFGFQLRRSPAYSLWEVFTRSTTPGGLHAAAAVIHGLLEAGTAALAVALLWLPRRRDIAGVSACAAAVIVGLVAGDGYFSFTYVCWFAPLVLVAHALAPGPAPARATDPRGRSSVWRPSRDPGSGAATA